MVCGIVFEKHTLEVSSFYKECMTEWQELPPSQLFLVISQFLKANFSENNIIHLMYGPERNS